MAEVLELGGLQGPFQPKPSSESACALPGHRVVSSFSNACIWAVESVGLKAM